MLKKYAWVIQIVLFVTGLTCIGLGKDLGSYAVGCFGCAVMTIGVLLKEIVD